MPARSEVAATTPFLALLTCRERDERPSIAQALDSQCIPADLMGMYGSQSRRCSHTTFATALPQGAKLTASEIIKNRQLLTRPARHKVPLQHVKDLLPGFVPCNGTQQHCSAIAAEEKEET
jgi:hypothetical protein